jgi:hypothetical protein
MQQLVQAVLAQTQGKDEEITRQLSARRINSDSGNG